MARSLQEMAKQHLMLHFSDMSVDADEITVIDHGEGYYVFDTEGNRYIDGLSGLYCANLGHSHGDEIGAVAHEQMAKLPFVSNWTVAHPSSIEAATRIADLAPRGLDRVFFTSGGSEAVESAYKIAVQWHAANGQPQRRKVIARKDAYHGVTLGALSLTGMPVCRTPFEPLPIPTHHVSNTNAYRHPAGGDEDALCRALLDEIEETLEFEVAETVAMIIAEPVQNAGGCFVPPRGYWQGLREICDRHGILLVSDEVICAWGRIGSWFGGQRFDYVPDLITFAKGVTAGHFAFGGMIISDKVAEPFLSGAESYMHGYTFGGHPVGAAVALATIDILEREQIPERVRANEEHARARLEELLEIPIVGDVRGCGHFFALELVRDQESKEALAGPVAEWLLKDVLTKRLYENGLICRLDDRADPIVQIAPPLIGDEAMFDEITAILRDGLEHAAERIDERPAELASA
jgi:adenosylmethionine-8-amino-7-oxononanoate aminotransferase